MKSENGIVRVGMEIEVPIWKDDWTFKKVAQKLVNDGYMWGIGSDWTEPHAYQCTCKKGCGQVRSGNVIIPPLVSMTHDSSLPNTGAEFVTSPILLTDVGNDEAGMDALRKVWDVVVKDAQWRDDIVDYGGENMCSPSIHMHVSVTKGVAQSNETLQPAGPSDYINDVAHVLTLYVPELFAVASSVGIKRGVQYRVPTRPDVYNEGSHHNFIHVRKAIFNKMLYIEWRLFEAAYKDWDYVEACTYLSATLTRGLMNKPLFSHLMSQGYANPIDNSRIIDAINTDDADELLAEFDMNRFDVLRKTCLGAIKDDEKGEALLVKLFDKTEAMYA